MRTIRLLCGLLCALPPSMLALAADDANSIQKKFQGVWAMDGAPCDKIFTKKRGDVSFVRFHGAKAPGLIVKGDRIQGSQASCKLISVKENASVLTAVLGCREEIIFDKVVVHLRFTGGDAFVRFDPAVPEIATSFHRCRV